VYGPLDANHYVVDFIALRSALKTIVAALDHRVLLPTQHPEIRITTRSGEIEVAFADRRWILPKDDCLLLPIAATTTELLAQTIGEQLLAKLAAAGCDSPEIIRIEVGEGSGASAVYCVPANNQPANW
jgi:6-pyruvoyltetrahydropterin/6-carboxytetrahydropterin synthase